MIEGEGARLLYRSSTGLEKSLAHVDGDRITAINAELIRDIWDADNCPINLLQYLAWAYGVNYWNDDWSETTKRSWVKNQLLYKSYRGTAAGLKMAVQYAGQDISRWGYTVNDIKVRPQQVFSGASLTPAQREEWLSSLPQLRIWRVQEQGNAGSYKSFLGSDNIERQHNYRFCIGGAYPTPSTAIERLKRRARWIVNDVEQDVLCESIGTYWQIHMPGLVGQSVFSNLPIRPDRYFIPSQAWRRIVTVQPTPELPWRSQIGPSLEPISASYERVVVDGTRGYSVFSDTPIRGKYFVPTTATLRIYERYAVNDGSAGPQPTRPAVQFMGVGRYGFPKFTAWANVSLGGVRSEWGAGEGINVKKFWLPHNYEPLRQIRAAALSSLRMADKVMLDIGPKPRFVAAGTPLLAGIDALIVGRP